MHSDRISSSLAGTQANVAAVLHWPDNLGIEFRRLRLPTRPETDLLVVFARGLADEERVRLWAIEPLERLALHKPNSGRLGPDDIQSLLPAPRLRNVNSISAAVRGVLDGGTALFCEGADEAVLIETQAPIPRPGERVMAEATAAESFGSSLAENVAHIRRRLRDPALVARSLDLPRDRGRAALVYLEGRAMPDLLDRVQTFVTRRFGEESLRRGLTAGLSGKLGLLPDVLTSRWPDQVAALLDAGHVAILVDRLPRGYVAPVTAPAALHGVLDVTLTRPLSVALRLLRLLMALVVLTVPALVVALLNYHQEMMPTPFILARAAVREQAGFPIIFEVLFLELAQEVIREAAFHLPLRMAPGAVLVAGGLLLLLLAQGGVVGTLPAAVSIGLSFIILGLLNYEILYLTRIWRFGVLLAAAAFGFFGISALLFVFFVYLFRAESFGVPFIGETGLSLTAPGRVSSRRQWGKLRARPRTVR